MERIRNFSFIFAMLVAVPISWEQPGLRHLEESDRRLCRISIPADSSKLMNVEEVRSYLKDQLNRTKDQLLALKEQQELWTNWSAKDPEEQTTAELLASSQLPALASRLKGKQLELELSLEKLDLAIKNSDLQELALLLPHMERHCLAYVAKHQDSN